jgi:uncharacterized integral membrane protein (TIGR00697 family)
MSDVSAGNARQGFKYLDWSITAFVTILLISNVIAGRLVQFGPFVATSAMFCFPLSYILSDIFCEVYGYSTSRRVVWFGALANVIMVLMFLLANSLPIPVFFADGKKAFDVVLGMVPRVVLFSILAYIVGSFANDIIMSKIKMWMVKWDPTHKHLWIRTIGSTIVGEGFDSLIFIFGVFLFTIPFAAVVTMFLVQWVVKVLIEVIMTPVTYVVVGALKKAEGIDVVATADSSHTPFSFSLENAEKNLKADIKAVETKVEAVIKKI